MEDNVVQLVELKRISQETLALMTTDSSTQVTETEGTSCDETLELKESKDYASGSNVCKGKKLSDPKKKLNKRFECVCCKNAGKPSAFRTRGSLSNHIIKMHMNEAPVEATTAKPEYLCELCIEKNNKVVFDSKSRYHDHLGLEHRTYLFTCEHCSLSFKLKVNYKAHVLTHNVPANKPFKCDVCLGTFVNRAGYESHCRRFPGPHAKQSCSHCGISFTNTRHLTNHRCKVLLLEEAKERAMKGSNIKSANGKTLEKKLIEKVVYRPLAVAFTEPLRMDGSEGGEVVPGTQLVRLDIPGYVNESQQVYQVNVAEWNVVAPFFLRADTSIAIQPSTSSSTPEQ